MFLKYLADWDKSRYYKVSTYHKRNGTIHNEGIKIVSNTKTTIELNGKRYDAATGKIVDSSNLVAKKSPTPSQGMNLDGFTAHNSKKSPVKRPPASRAATTKAPVQHRKPEHAKTLMRHVVKKPVIAAAKTKNAPKSQVIVSPDTLIDQRVKRANHIPKSPFVSRFGAFGIGSPIKKHIAPVPVQPAPKQSMTSAPAKTAAQKSFGTALESATSHTQPKLRKNTMRRRAAKKFGISSKALGISSAMLVVVVLGGFIAYQNVPNVAMRVAATKAGFAAAMPGYTPSGFAMHGKIQASNGKVTISFKSNTDTRSYAVTQEPSNWTSQSLLDNYVAVNNQPYQTYEDKGRTIYIYNGTNATWVNGGVWYQVGGNSNLNSDQLINIANSL